MRREVVLAILLVAFLAVTMTPAHPTAGQSSPHLAPASTASLTLTSTSQLKVSASQVWVRSGNSSVYAGSAPTKSYTFDVSPYSTIYSESMAFLVTTASGLYARILLTQGSNTLVNTTATSFSVTPAITVTPVVETVVATAYLNGTVPRNGNYPVYTNATSTIQFALFSSATWSYSTTTYRESLTTYANTSFGYWLNSTTLSIPFPTGITANYATLTVLANSTATAFQVSPTALFVLISNEAPRAWLTIVASFQPAATPNPPNPVVSMPSPTLVGSTYTESTTWTNSAYLAYNGIFILELNNSAPLNLSSVKLYVNGTLFGSTSFVISGTNLTILPGYLTTYEGQAETFKVSFAHSPAPVPTVVDSLVLFSPGGYPITLGDVLLAGVVVLAFYILGSALSSPNPTYRDILSSWKGLAAIAGLLAIYFTGI